MNTRIKFGRMTRIFAIRGVDVYVHWSVILIIAIMLSGSLRRPLVTLVAITSYFGMLLLHEYGHLIAAQQKGCKVWSIELYPLHGWVRFETPWSKFDHCVIAWAGVLAQSLVAFPLIAFVIRFGYTPYEPVNAFLAILGFFSLFIACFNLLPKAPLDGAIAWQIVPLYLQRVRARKTKRPAGWRTY